MVTPLSIQILSGTIPKAQAKGRLSHFPWGDGPAMVERCLYLGLESPFHMGKAVTIVAFPQLCQFLLQ